jgi:hypothetical protein
MRRAICVGIDNYLNAKLDGCVSDAQRLADVLERHENKDPNFALQSLIAPKGGKYDDVTRSKLRSAIEMLFKYPADAAILAFSGHGTENNLGGYLVTQDAKSYDEGVAMSDVISLANGSKASEVLILLDCCHSGHAGNLPAIDNQKALLREGVSIITASRSDQVSVETSGGGLFTSLVVDALKGGAADIMGNVTAPGIYAYVEAALGAWNQRPLFKSHVSKLVPIRKCEPAIPPAILRELPVIFPLPAEDLALSPSFEKYSPTPVDSKVVVFEKLQALNRVHLVVPVGADHMYDAAIQSLSCRLTASGRYYWRLARDGRI